MLDPPSTAASDTSNAANVAKARRVDSDVDTASAFDLPRAIALATALDAFLAAGMSERARPLAAELAALLKDADRARANVVSIGTKRTR